MNELNNFHVSREECSLFICAEERGHMKNNDLRCLRETIMFCPPCGRYGIINYFDARGRRCNTTRKGYNNNI